MLIFALDLEAVKVAKMTGISRNSINKDERSGIPLTDYQQIISANFWGIAKIRLVKLS